MSKVLLRIIPTLFLVFLAACSEPIIATIEYNNVVRVFWHEGQRYSILIKEGNELSTVSFPRYQCDSDRKYTGEGIKIIADVSADKPMWAKLEAEKNKIEPDCFKTIYIHVRTESDILGGGWNHGKFGSGQTVVIK